MPDPIPPPIPTDALSPDWHQYILAARREVGRYKTQRDEARAEVGIWREAATARGRALDLEIDARRAAEAQVASLRDLKSRHKRRSDLLEKNLSREVARKRRAWAQVREEIEARKNAEALADRLAEALREIVRDCTVRGRAHEAELGRAYLRAYDEARKGES